jgi:long-chain acyl-CoA synthetase
MGELAQRGAGVLQGLGVVTGDRVMIMSENRPEWGMTYFATLLAGGVAVPLDSQLTLPEVENLIRVSRSKAIVLSRRVAERLAADAGLAVPAPDHPGEGNPLFHVWSPAHPALEQYFERVLGESNPQVLAYDELLWSAEAPKAGVIVRPAVKGDATASVIFTSGTTGQPKGVMLSHKNFTAMAAKLSSLFQLYKHDRLLSVLPMHHTFEFSAGFLMPLSHGACIDYMEEVEADSLAAALKDEGITGMVGVPALWQLLERKIYKNVADAGPLVEKAFDAVIEANRGLRDKLPWDIGAGKALFYPVHRKLGGRMRLLISGGSALPPDTMKSFRGLGFDLFEGYGMTEAAPVLTVTRPGDKVIPGSVGRPLPGIDVKIATPDAQGIGEVIAKGPNVMSGYFENQQATEAALIDGWLHTGDLGRIDDDGNLYIVGRKKEMILGPSGENVYPDELEELYGDSPFIKEISVVGLAGEAGLETVAALVVPDYEHDENVTRETVRENVREHIRKISKAQPLYKRVKTFHLWDFDLPKTSTRKVKRRDVVVELQKLEKAARGGLQAKRAADSSQADGVATSTSGWIWSLVAEVSQKPKASVTGESRLDQLGFDSLMFNELAVALEAAGVTLPDPTELLGLETVADVEALVTRIGVASAEQRRRTLTRKKVEPVSDDIDVPQPLVRMGRRVLRDGMFTMYDKYLSTRLYGTTQVPPTGGFIVAANHASHLDTGLVKFALGEQGDIMVALAAKDYFFEDPVRRMYFENFTNLLPMERHGSLRESLRLAGDVIRQGYILLIFPEGTRSETGVMTDFKPSLGYLAMTNKCGILPMYLSGTYDAMPKGKYLPKRGGDVAAHVGPFVSFEQVQALAKAAASRSEQYNAITAHVESTVRRLAPTVDQWTLGDAGTMPMNDYLKTTESNP